MYTLPYTRGTPGLPCGTFSDESVTLRVEVHGRTPCSTRERKARTTGRSPFLLSRPPCGSTSSIPAAEPSLSARGRKGPTRTRTHVSVSEGNDCSSNPCGANGDCNPRGAVGYDCLCKRDYSETHCETGMAMHTHTHTHTHTHPVHSSTRVLP